MNDIPPQAFQFFWGALGALAPELVRLYKIVTGPGPRRLPNFDAGYTIISVGFVILGGFVAVA